MIKHGVRSALVLGSIGRRYSAERDWIAAAEWEIGRRANSNGLRRKAPD